ncbi:MAG: zinc-binding dehydrogenase [Bdellovibrionales bacterium]|nr:zinc-binding dehydrogenase [Bdellovibrionales bacterium]
MKAIFFEEHGEAGVLKYADLPTPQPHEGEALIKVSAVALNHLDIWVRRGWKGLQLDLPHITGSDIVCTLVESNGPSAIPTGTRVMINPGVCTTEDEWTRQGLESVSPGYRLIGEHLRGGLAEYVCVPIDNVFRAPSNRSDEELAAGLLVGTTCWRMLLNRGELRPGQSVLVVGAGGGVNSLAIQLATSMGAQVYAVTGSDEKVDKSKKLGALQVLNYAKVPNWHVEVLKLTKGRGVDIVIDNVGAATFGKSLRAVARGGKIITVGNTSGPQIDFDNRLLFTKQIAILGSTMGSTQDFIDCQEYLHQQNIIPVIDRVEGLDQGIQMLHYLEEGKQFGKIVLKP